ncbi:mitochondrial carrier domain-containing protein [Trichophaea hybrida]|nr:mitochondrial carrier domain-containing protein [Trichophaea hybrida]
MPGHPDICAHTAAKDISFGSLAGMIGKVFEYPFDTVKVRLQSQPEELPLRYRGPIDCFVQGLKQDGLLGMYRGISSPLVGAAAENSCLFFSYNLAQTFSRRNFYQDLGKTDPLPLAALVICGGASGSFASFILTPIELIKCKMQVQSLSTDTLKMHNGTWALIGEVYRAYGLRGLWKGQTGTFLRETGGSASWFGAYEYVSRTLRRRKSNDTLSSWEMMFSGAVAGVSYNLILFPADSIKSRMQTQAIGQVNEGSKGFWEVGMGIYRAGGVTALYRGCGITCFRSAPSSAIIFFCYEKLKDWF